MICIGGYDGSFNGDLDCSNISDIGCETSYNSAVCQCGLPAEEGNLNFAQKVSHPPRFFVFCRAVCLARGALATMKCYWA